MSYATISIFGQPKKLYRETLMKYVVSSQEKPQNFPIYSVHSDMDSFIIYNAETNPDDIPNGIAAEPKEIKKYEDIAIEPKDIVKERSTIQIQEISDDKEKSDNKENSNTLAKKDYTTPDTNYEHEIFWNL